LLPGKNYFEKCGHQGFGYDPSSSQGYQTFAEIDSALKNTISHRAIAANN
jgi:inosine/xanthosine triphosphate pyrophosphatase family protein